MKNKISLFAIYLYEAKQLFRGRAFSVVSALVFLVGIYAVIYGKNEANEQTRKIALLQDSVGQQRKAFADSLQKHDTGANITGEALGPVHINKPDGIAAMSFGQRDIHRFAQQITNGSYFYNKYATGYSNKTLSGEIVNPFKLMSGHLDIGFVVLLIFPLYLILLYYNIWSAEKEGGTLSLLTIQFVSVRKIILHKILFRFFITAILGLLLMLIAGIVNGVLSDERWWLYCAAFLSYIFCWTGIFALIVALKKNSGFNVLAMVGTWLLFTILLPSFLNVVLNTAKPIPAQTELAAAVQKANAEVWALPKKIKIDSFKAVRPYYANSFDTIGAWDDPKFYRVNHYLTDHYIIPFEEMRIRKAVARNIFSDKLNYFPPALIMQSALNELAGSNMQQMLAYDTSGYAYFKKISRFTDDRIFLKANNFSWEDMKKMPVLYFKPTIDYASITLQLILLVSVGVLCGAIFYARMKG